MIRIHKKDLHDLKIGIVVAFLIREMILEDEMEELKKEIRELVNRPLD